MSVIGVTPFKRHALYAWVPDSRHRVSLSRCDGVYLLTYLLAWQQPAAQCSAKWSFFCQLAAFYGFGVAHNAQARNPMSAGES